jgi:HAD superfamily hydrolase (TIGR01459 family)
MKAELTSLDALTNRFTVFFVDQFGVLHNGEVPYSGAIEALAEIKRRGAKVVILSNSGKRSSANMTRFEALGFAPSSYDLFLTSGEVAHSLVKDRTKSGQLQRGAKCLMIARDNDMSAVDGLDLKLVEDGADADIVLIAGSKGDSLSLQHYRQLLAGPAVRGIPCLCTNPDKTMITKVGLRFGAGAIAELYQEMGGTVEWIGKPFPAIYRAALTVMGDPQLATVVCIGDSIEHDIAGGANAGLSTALVRSGILADASEKVLTDHYRRFGVTPDFSLAAFSFQHEDSRS